MNDKQRLALLRVARKELRQTEKGYHEQGPHWGPANAALDKLEADLKSTVKPPPKVPNLGPIKAGGRSVLQQDCTHITDGLGWPAFDDIGPPGTSVIAPEDVLVYDSTSNAQGGDAFYVEGVSGIRYWVAHITTVPAQGRRFKKGEKMTTISSQHKVPHVHLGIDARKLLNGKHLRTHYDYSHGAPLIGTQLAAAAT